MNSFKIFFKQFSILAGLVLLLSIIISLFIPKINITIYYAYILIFLYTITLAVYKIISKSMENRISQFANIYMLVNFGKMIFFTFIIVIYAYLNKEDAISFMLTFFSYYFIFTGFEVVSLLFNKK